MREGAEERFDRVDYLPPLFATRLLSIRAFDSSDMMMDADVVGGAEAADAIARFFEKPSGAYLHVHYAKPGCFAARVDRA